VSLVVSTELIKSTTCLNESKSADAANNIESILPFSTSMFDCSFNSDVVALSVSSIKSFVKVSVSRILSDFSLLILDCNNTSASVALWISEFNLFVNDSS